MVMLSPWNNLCGVIKSKPPLVVFTLCLIAFAATTFVLSYYIEHKDKIENHDAKEDWNSLLKYMSDVEVCLKPYKIARQSKSDDLKFYTSVNVLASITVPYLPNNVTNFEGIVPLNDWSSKCPDKTVVPEYVGVNFTLKVDEQLVDKPQNICVAITGPEQFMPKFASSLTCNSSKLIGSLGSVVVARTKEVSLDSCDEGKTGKITFDRSYFKHLQVELFLSLNDKSIINIHLLVTSYFLVAIILVVLCYGILKENRNLTSSDSMQFLAPKSCKTLYIKP